jgi:hypothetical protein
MKQQDDRKSRRKSAKEDAGQHAWGCECDPRDGWPGEEWSSREDSSGASRANIRHDVRRVSNTDLGVSFELPPVTQNYRPAAPGRYAT